MVQAGLGRAVGGRARGRPAAAHAADHDDRPAALILHHRVSGLRDVQRRDQVELDHLGVEARRRGGRRRVRRPAGVAHGDVQPPENLNRMTNDPWRLLRVPDIRLGEDGGPTLRARQFGGLGPPADQHPGA